MVVSLEDLYELTENFAKIENCKLLNSMYGNLSGSAKALGVASVGWAYEHLRFRPKLQNQSEKRGTSYSVT